MKKKIAAWQLIKDSLDATFPVMLLYVLESSGSSPGRQGFFMAVTVDGKMQGSIGGGMMEQKLAEKAKSKMQLTTGNGQSSELIKQVHNKAAATNQSGMICSGEQTVWMYPVQQNDKNAINQIISCLNNFENATLRLSPAGIFFETLTPEQNVSFAYKNEEDWLYQESLGYQNHLYIIGGGHCSLALSNLVSTLDFYIHLFDNRNDLLTVEQNETAHEKKLVNDYSELSSLIPEGENSYVVVMTFGYRTDDVVVRTLLNKEFKYFGLLGSKAKVQKMFADYRSEGLDENLLKKIHAPIGLQIKSETPEEIAVSIAAEIIKVKNASPPAPLQQSWRGEKPSEVEEPFPKYTVKDRVQFEYAQNNRKESTEAETKLWEQLRSNKLGVKFRRQHPVENFIVDFVCLEKGLVVEVDGGYHNREEQQRYDAHRTSILIQKGFAVLRFTNEEVLAAVYLVRNKNKTSPCHVKTFPTLNDLLPSPALLERGRG